MKNRERDRSSSPNKTVRVRLLGAADNKQKGNNSRKKCDIKEKYALMYYKRNTIMLELKM